MSIAQVEKALTDFAVHKTGSAIVLKGEWGTGKTHLWNKIIKSQCESLVRKTYSYVSLFGLNSLSDLKRSIFENSVPSNKAGIVTTKESVIENIKKLEFSDATAALRKLFSHGKEAKIPFVGSFGGAIESIQYALVKDTLICIDDFERRGSALSSRDVLGLISNLIESKDCSVILILNEGSLQKDDEFFTFSEKVFDYEVRYAPTLDEAVSVVFSGTDLYEKKIVENVKKLEINNIRLLRKVKYFAGLIRPLVNGKPDEILDDSTKLIPLAIYAKYSGSEKVVNIGDLENHKGELSLFSPKKKGLTAEQEAIEDSRIAKEDFLRAYGYGEADDFTIEIIKLVKNGYADSNSLMPLIYSVTVAVERSKRRKIFTNAWYIFHNDMSLSDADLLVLFENAVIKSSDVISPYEMDGVLEIFTAAGLEELGRSIVDKYFKILDESRSIVHRKDMYRYPENPYIAEKLEKYFGDVSKVWSIEELVYNYLEKPFAGESLELLSALTTDQFYTYFKFLGSPKFKSYAQSLVDLGSRTEPADFESHYAIVFLKVFAALKRMHDESPVMSLRMKKFMEYQQMYEHKISLVQQVDESK